jgi:outer membrane protein assembly factor BamB
MTFGEADGHVLGDAPLPLVHSYNSGAFTNSVLVLMSSTSTNGTGGWTIGGYSLQDGSALWLRALGDHPSVMYGVASGLVFYLGGTAKGDALIATNANDGAQMWTTDIPGYAYVDGDGSQIYATFSGQATQVSGFSSADGATAWSHSWPGSSDRQTGASEVTVYQRIVYFGVTAYDANHDPTLPSTMYAVAAADGSTVWKQIIPGWLRYPTETDHL